MELKKAGNKMSGMISAILKGKRGILFTLIAVALLAILLLSYSATNKYSMQEKAGVIETKIDTMNRFLQEVDNDMENAAYISGYRALIGIEDNIASTGLFVTDTETAFEEIFMNGTYAGQNISVMENNTFLNWTQKIKVMSAQMGLNLSIEVDEVSIYHVDPWTVRIGVNASVNITDFKDTARWEREKMIYSDISVLGFEDPMYTVYTGGNVLKRINVTPYEGNFTQVNDTTNIRDHVAQTYYAEWSGAPSFLNRLENDFNASEFGIESFVTKSEVSTWHSCPTETSSIDSIYWQCNVSIDTWPVANWSGFRIDNETDMSNNTRVTRYMMEDFIQT